VFGGVFDKEFSESSIQLFEQVKRGEVVCLYSEVVDEELMNAPEAVRAFAMSLPKHCVEKHIITPEIESLAEKYISEKIVGRNNYEDCKHIAHATIHQADVLVSWNFKHIVNANRISGYNSVNLSHGFSPITIRSPKQIIEDEK
jgi:predicted nucleic acid-binding protein